MKKFIIVTILALFAFTFAMSKGFAQSDSSTKVSVEKVCKADEAGSATEAQNPLAEQSTSSGCDGVQIARRGCCSHHGGVCGCNGGSAQCCDGALSPSCGCD